MASKQNYILLLGGNIGDINATFERTMLLLRELGDFVCMSSLYRTAPWGFSEKVPDFYNQVIEIASILEPLDMLLALQKIEKVMGRSQKTSNGAYASRTIDIDILFCGQRMVESERLTIPHPQIANRRFALVPLCEKWGRLIHPKLGVELRQLLQQCPDDSCVTLCES